MQMAGKPKLHIPTQREINMIGGDVIISKVVVIKAFDRDEPPIE
jgi:hypothetical protein